MKQDLSTLLVLVASVITMLILGLLFFMGVTQLDL
jgi:hypothetical protein